MSFRTRTEPERPSLSSQELTRPEATLLSSEMMGPPASVWVTCLVRLLPRHPFVLRPVCRSPAPVWPEPYALKLGSAREDLACATVCALRLCSRAPRTSRGLVFT